MGRPDTGSVAWQLEVLPKATRQALDFLATQEWLKQSDWYLAGGTALALQTGHRQSVDLDFFTPEKTFTANSVIGQFSANDWTTEVGRDNTVFGTLRGAKVSFIAYPPFKSVVTPKWYGTVRVLDSRDIAVMKIIAISQRGRKRDFIDLYWYAQHREQLVDVLRRVPDQYATVTHDFHHILKSMMYFADAEEDPMPTLFFEADWKTVKAYFQREVPKLARELLRIP